MKVIFRRAAAGAAAGVLAYGLVVVAIVLIFQTGLVTLYGLFMMIYAAVPAGGILAWPFLWVFRVRPAWTAAGLGLLFAMSAAYLVTSFFQPEPWAPILAVVIVYALVATVTTPGLAERLAWWRTGPAVARVPLLAPDLAGYRIEMVDASPGFLHYRLVPATGPAVGVTIWPPGFGGLEGRVVERRDATVAITAGPDVQPELVEVIAWTLAPRPHLFQGVAVGGGR
ncbi:hypothetical protein GT755_32070 [Herbidospora sp. NEAU-GS84]|uniref:Uncharacterized protein n=1 Tax=Herbidospora solisilvae TaxID=2696284 RepID=A0A7C9NLI2_9ACTN|nr:hypothetical protein [Herbidospora solisilvae]NAS26298.1 hypothetical protein [Herbidospora solisilvae]